MASVRLFVYGTLRRGQPNHALLGGAPLVGSVLTEPCFELIESAGYPALVPGTTAIEGEVYAVDPALLAQLDAFEGPGYVRALVRLADGTAAFSYLAAPGAR